MSNEEQLRRKLEIESILDTPYQSFTNIDETIADIERRRLLAKNGEVIVRKYGDDELQKIIDDVLINQLNNEDEEEVKVKTR